MATAAKKAPAKKQTTAVVKYDELLAARAVKANKAAVSAGGEWLSVKGATLSYQGNAVPGNSMDLIVISSVLENQLYDPTVKYDPNNPSSPICYAFGETEEEMAPHEKSPLPQADACSGCPHNEWGSGDGGQGKACKNVRRTGNIPADALKAGA